MARRSIPRKSVKIAAFANKELDLLVDELSTSSPSLKATKEDVAGALILAARRSPIEATKAIIRTYWDSEEAEYARLSQQPPPES